MGSAGRRAHGDGPGICPDFRRSPKGRIRGSRAWPGRLRPADLGRAARSLRKWPVLLPLRSGSGVHFPRALSQKNSSGLSQSGAVRCIPVMNGFSVLQLLSDIASACCSGGAGHGHEERSTTPSEPGPTTTA